MDLCPSFAVVVAVLRIAAFVLDQIHQQWTDRSFQLVADSAEQKDWSIAAVSRPSAGPASDQWSSLIV